MLVIKGRFAGGTAIRPGLLHIPAFTPLEYLPLQRHRLRFRSFLHSGSNPVMEKMLPDRIKDKARFLAGVSPLGLLHMLGTCL